MDKKILFLLILTFLAVGCTAQPGAGRSNSTGSPTPAAEVSTLDGLMAQLRASGAVVETGDAVEQPFFSVPGKTILVNGLGLQVFEYASEAARLAESGQISKDGSTIGMTKVSWVEPPHFWAKGKYIALYVGSQPAMIDLLNRVMGQALTQP